MKQEVAQLLKMLMVVQCQCEYIAMTNLEIWRESTSNCLEKISRHSRELLTDFLAFLSLVKHLEVPFHLHKHGVNFEDAMLAAIVIVVDDNIMKLNAYHVQLSRTCHITCSSSVRMAATLPQR
jgi:hypothetical protein